MYDVIIIGAGAAGMGAAVAASEKNLNTLVISKSLLKEADDKPFGFVDFKKLIEKFQQLVKNNKLEFKETEVINLEKNVVSFSVEVKSGALYYGKAVITAVGSESLEFDKITQKSAEGKIKVDSSQKTSVAGIYAVGNCANVKNISEIVAVGEGVKAIEIL